MPLKQFTIDLAEAPEEIAADIRQNEQAEETLLEKVNDRFPDEGFNHPECPPDFEEKFYELREQRAELQSKKARIEEFLEDEEQAGDWSHHRFTFQEPSTEDGLYIQGRSQALAEEAEQRGEKIDGRMFGVTQMLQRALVEAPPEAPDNLAGALPNFVGDWLLEELDNRTTQGVSDELGNTSPQEALRRYRSSQGS